MTESPNPAFPATRWSLVAAAASDGPAASRALEELCQAYWFPIYSYARRRGLSPADAEDQTQSFFAQLLEKGGLKFASPDKGRMRTFLLTAMQRSLANQRRHDGAIKRGGRAAIVSIDVEQAEQQLERELATDESPDRAFERSWANAVVASVHRRLEAYFSGSGQAKIFEKLSPYLAWGGGDQPYAEIAAKLGMSERAVRTAVHRMRARFRDFLVAEIRETVADPLEAKAEVDHLKQVLAGR
ncbi:MAG: sigma-70 family RNA polymerase sigma factor [Verrucomicrobiales bacterium]